MGNVLTVNIGSAPNDTTGDPLRTAMTKIMTAVNGVAGSFNSATAPTSVMPFQSWFDTSSAPATLRFFDGTSWVAAGTLNQSTHVFAPTLGGTVGGDLIGSLPNPTIAALAVTNAKMAAGSAAANVGALSGDLTGTLPTQTIAKIQGTAVSGVTGTGNAVLSASPTLTGTVISPTLSITANPTLPITFAGASTQNNILANVTGASATLAEGAAFFQINGTAGSGTGSGAYKIALTASAVVNSGSASGFGANITCTLGASLAGSVGGTACEFDFSNADANRFGLPAGSNYAAGVLINGSGLFTNNVGLYVTSNNSTFSLWDYGIAVGQGSLAYASPSARTAAYYDATNSPVSFKAIGTHTTGIDHSGATETNFIIGPGSLFNVNGAGAITGTHSIIQLSGGAYYELSDLGAGTDLKNWQCGSVGGLLVFQAVNDAMSAGNAWLTVARAVAVPTIATFGAAVITSASSTTRAGFNIPQGTAPTSPANGDIWMTVAGLFYRFNGTTKGPL